MAQTLKINGVSYAEVKEIKIPKADDPSKFAVFPDTSDATATDSAVKDGVTYYAGGEKREGAMPVNGAVSGKISNKDGVVTVPGGYTPGGTVALDDTEKAKLIPGNIRQGVTVLGVSGEMSPSEGVHAQSKTVTPTKNQQVVQPDSGYTHLTDVTVAAIPSQYPDTSDADIAAEYIKQGKVGYGKNGKRYVGTHTDPSFTLANGVLSIV